MLAVSPCIHLNGEMRADDFLDDFTQEVAKTSLDETVGKALLEIAHDKGLLDEIVRTLKLSLSKEKIERLKEIMQIMLGLEELAQNKDLAAQWALFKKHSESLHNPTEDDVKKLIADLEKTCPLVFLQGAIIKQLEEFYAGVSKGMQGIKANEILEYVIQDLA